MIPLEKYADLCALMADTAGDEGKENAIAAAHGVSPEEWKASKTGYTAKMSDPADMGKTAMAFMPLYQAAQARARGGKEPCTLELYAKVHAEMAYSKDAMGNQPVRRFLALHLRRGFSESQRFRLGEHIGQ